MTRPVRFRVVESEDGTLLHMLVARRLPELGGAEARALIKGGAVYLGHLRVRLPTTRVATGERVTVYPEALAKEPLPADAVRFVHRDPSFVVLDKPPGVPVAQTRDSSRGTLAEALRRVLVDEGILRPYVGVVHRLDQGASGLVLFTIRGVANQSLHRQFVQHRIERHYRVRVLGDPPAYLRCDDPLVELRHGRVRVARDGEPRARAASTELRRLEPVDLEVEGRRAALLEATLHTGRTHQIRVHAQALGHAVLGDRKYGEAEGDPPSRLFLHADRLAFEHPESGERIELRAPRPEWARARDDDAP
ncbi:MAG: RluA family pseudouridine synthase [Myxococcales bacterium]|nr:RluA family pseudouridine synthase [Myxococcales bacterium]